MKRRFRYFTRSGWHIVEVPRKNLYKWQSSPVQDYNQLHYREICEWCEKTFSLGTWESKIISHGTAKPGVKRFAFQHERDKLMFMLRWS